MGQELLVEQSQPLLLLEVVLTVKGHPFSFRSLIVPVIPLSAISSRRVSGGTNLHTVVGTGYCWPKGAHHSSFDDDQLM